jgi:hypothetical protein
MHAGSLNVSRRAPQAVGAAMHPNRYEVLVIPADAFAAFRPKLRRLCAEMVRLLVLTPGRSDEWPETADLPVTGEVSLAGWVAEDAPAFVARLLATLIEGHSLAYAAALARQQAASTGPPPTVREPAGGDLWPPAPSSPPTPSAPTPGAGSGKANIIGPTTINPAHDAPIATRDPAEQARLTRLTTFMGKYCTLDELEMVAFDLGLNTEEFGRGLGLSQLARRLTLEMSRRDGLDELTARLARAVPQRAAELRGNE